jgi:site-specific recombinase XerD
MYLVKTKRSPFYQIVYNDEGKRCSLSTKQESKSEALKFLTDFKNHLKEEKKIKPITLKEFKSEYERYSITTKSFGYVDSIKVSLRLFVEFIGDCRLKKIDSRIVEKFLLSRYAISKHGAALYHRTLKAAFNTALRWNYISENPFIKVKLPKLPKKLPLFISEYELQLILKEVNSVTIRNMILLSNDTGMRLGEVVNLRWKNVDLQQKIIQVSNSDDFQTKSKQDRIIPLTNRLYDILIKRAPNIFTLKNNNDLVFLTKNKVKFNQDYVSKKFKTAVRDLGLNEGYKFHTLRHSYATNLVNSGASLFVVQHLLGHADLKTTQIYSHLKQQNLFDAVDLLNKAEAM